MIPTVVIDDFYYGPYPSYFDWWLLVPAVVQIALLIAIVVLVIRRLLSRRGPGTPPVERAQQVLRHRLAIGEIDPDDYAERMSLLRPGSSDRDRFRAD